jgi:hypothetical protein
LTIFSPTIRNGYSERWNLGVQRQFKGNTLVEVAYIGNHALKLPITQYLDYTNPAFLTTASNPSLSSTQVANPFLGLLPGSGLSTAKTISEVQLLQVYPQFTGLTVQNAPYGSSYYNALDVRMEKRAGYGITATANYQWSKLLERVSYLNSFDPKPEKRISQYDRTNHMVFGLTYEMPYGKGRPYGATAKRYLDLPFGGWVINGIYSRQTGAPLGWGDLVPTGQPINLNNREVAPGVAALNVNAFDRVGADQPVNHIRTFRSQFSNLRIDGNNDFSASTMKNFNFTEKTYFQLRFEAFNALNRPMFGGPNLSPTSSTFGIISGTNNNSRVIQVGGRIVF